MTVSAMDTAKLPLGGTEPPLAPVEPLPGPGPSVEAAGATEPLALVPSLPVVEPPSLASLARPVPAPAGRRARREERRQLRRLQRRYAAVGIAVLAAVFLLTVVALGGIR